MFRFLRRGYLKRVIRMNALRKGLVGGSPFWRAVWVFGVARGFWSKISKRGEAPVTFSESLDEGEAWAIVHVPEQSRRGRGEGRKALIGPRRKPPRTTSIKSEGLVAAGRRILAAPDAARINAILGAEVVSDPPPTRRERRRSRRAEKAAARSSA